MPICLRRAGIISFMEVTLLQKVDKAIPAWLNVIFGHLVSRCHNNNHNVIRIMLNWQYCCILLHFEASIVKLVPDLSTSGILWWYFGSQTVPQLHQFWLPSSRHATKTAIFPTCLQYRSSVQYCKQVFPFSGLCVFSEHKSSLISAAAAAGRHHLSERLRTHPRFCY